MNKLLTTSEVAEILRVSKPTAYNEMNRQDFPKVKIGRAWRVDEELLRAWIRKQSGQ